MLELLFSFTFMSKSKNTLETSLNLTPLFKTAVDAMVEGLVSNVNYLENRCHNFIQKKYDRNRRLPRTHVSFSGLQFSFLCGLLTPLMKVVKKRIYKTICNQSKQFLLLFYFLVYRIVSKLNLRLSFVLSLTEVSQCLNKPLLIY